MSFTTRRRLSVKVWGGLLAVCLLLCVGSFLRAVSSRALGRQPDAGRAASAQQPDAAQSGQSAALTSAQERRQQEEARAFHLAKRAPDDKATATSTVALQESYTAARQRLCQMAGYATAQDQALPAGAGAGSGWVSVESAPMARAALTAPCAADGATQWTPPQFDFGATLFAHGQAYPGGAVYLGGTLDRGLVRGDEQGWRTVLKGALGQVAIDPSDASVLYVAGPGLQLRKSRDGGRSFAVATEGLADEGLLVAPLALDANDPQRLWFGGRAIWRSVDGAGRWLPMSAPVAGDARVSALAVAAANSGYVLAGTSAGDIHRTFNSFNLAADESWPSVRPRAGFVSSLTYDPHNPNLAYATYSTVGGAHVWRSYDAGASWTSIDGAGTTALPDVPVHSLAVDPTNPARLYVGTDLGVFVSLDGGASWAVEQTGFGAAIVESLATGHTDEGPMLFAFTHGQGVWRVALNAQQCSYTISPARSVFEAAGGTGSVNVMTTSACAWTATSNAAWVTINTGATGTGNGTVTFTVAANTAATVRTGTLTIAGRTFTVEQGAQGGSCVTTPITSGQTLSGVLAPGDCFSRQRTSNLADRYGFTGTAGEAVVIALNASFTSQLYLYGPTDTLVASSNQVVNNTRIPESGFFTLPATGAYVIEATSFNSGTTGTYTLSLAIVPVGCGVYTLLPTRQSFDAAGGEGRLQVATSSNCPWTATSNVNWVTITSGASGGGSLPVTYRVAANTGAYRTGTLTIAGQTFTVEQAGMGGSCLPVPITPGQTVNGALSQADCRARIQGGASDYADRYSFTARAGEQLIITANASFVPDFYLTTAGGDVLARGDTRIPAGRGSFAVPADGTYLIEFSSRDSNVTGNYALTVTVLPPGCAYAIAPASQSFEATGGTGSVAVTAGENCAWTATTGASWITITNGSGTGTGTATYTVAANEGAYRTAVIIVAGQSVTVIQAGAGGNCLTPLALTPGQPVSGQLSNADCRSRLRSDNFSSSVFYTDRYLFTGTAGQQVRLTATSTNFVPYLYLTTAAGTVLADGRQRIPASGSVFVLPATATYIVEVTSESSGGAGSYMLNLETLQANCGYTVAPALLRFDPAGGTGAVTVTAPADCPWLAVSNASWLTITGAASGAGNGTVNIAVAANNTTVLRRATLTIATQVVTIEQAGTGGTCLPQPLTVNQPVMGSLGNADCQTTDRYSFTAMAGEQLAALLNTTAFNPTLRVLDAQGRVLASGTTRAPALGFVSVPATGTYFVEVGNSSPTTATYTLTLLSLAANCTYALTPTAQQFEAAGGMGSVLVTAPDNCPRVASANVSWLTITAGGDGSGTGTVEFTVAPNTGTTQRTGTLNIGGRLFTVEQAGANGSCATQPITVGATINGTLSQADCRSRLRVSSTFYADRYSFDFIAGQQFAIAFNATSLNGYVYLTDQNGVVLAEGSGQQLRLPAGNNFLTLPASGTYFIEVTSQGALNTGAYTLRLLAPTECAYSFLPAQQRVESAGGTSSFNLVTASNCQWTATSNAPWLTVNTASGTGSGAVSFTVAANTNGLARTGTISFGSQSFIVEQAGAGGTCGAQPLPANQPLNASLSPADCRARTAGTSGEARVADRYSFTAAEGDQIAIAITPASSFSSQTLTLLDPRGLVVTEGSARVPTGTGFLTLPASGTYTVEYAATPTTGDYTITLFTIPAGCVYTLTPERQAFEFTGGEGSFAVATSSNCQWTVVSSASWVTVTTGSGTGNGTASFTVAINNSLTARSTTLLVGGRSFIVEQAGVGGSCATLALTPGQFVSGELNSADCPGRLTNATRADRYSFAGTAGQQISLQALIGSNSTLLLGVFAPDGTQLARVEGARLPASGLLTLPASGIYVVEIAVTFNPSQDFDYRLLLTTTPGGCVYALNPSRQSFDSTSGAGSVNVLTGDNCSWTVTSTVNWITLATTSGTGNGAVAFTLAPNASVTLRTGQLFIGGQFVTIEQAGAGGNCSPVPITPGQPVAGRLSDGDCSARVRTGVPGDRYSFTAAAGQQVLITATSDQNSGLRPDIYLLDANGALVAIGTNAGSLTGLTRLPANSGYFVLPGAGNYFIEIVPGTNTSSSRGNYTLTLTVATAGCSYAISPTAGVFDAGAATGSFNVITGANCQWTVTSSATWITISSGATGTGNGAVNFAVAANTGSGSRSGTITVADAVYNITQAGMGGTCVPAPLTPGQTVSGNLGTGDCASPVNVNARGDRYVFNGTAGDRLTITVTTQVTSTTLSLYGPDGALLAQADGVRLPRSGIIILPATGTYTIALSSFNTGNYMINVSLQAPCAYTVAPATVTVEAAGGTATVMVTTAAGCDWNAVAMNDWIGVPANSNFGSGNGTFSFTVAPNPDATPRTGTLIVAGQTVTVMQVGRVALASAASFSSEELAPDAIAVGFGQGLATGTAVANTPTLPLTLAGTTVRVRDSRGMTLDAGLFAVTPTQVNFLVPTGTALGDATVIITSGNGTVTTGTTRIAAVAPGIFAANADGRGVAAGVVLRVRNGVSSFEPVARFDAMTNRFVPVPIDLGPAGDEVFLILFGTGVRNRTALAAVTAQVGGADVPVLFAGPQGLAGLDQLNLALPRSLAGRGEVSVAVTVDGKPANIVQVVIR